MPILPLWNNSFEVDLKRCFYPVISVNDFLVFSNSPFCRSRASPAEGSRHEWTISCLPYTSTFSQMITISFLHKMLMSVMEPTDRMSSVSLLLWHQVFLPFDLWPHHSDTETSPCRYRPAQKEIVTQSDCSLPRASWKSWNRSEMSWVQKPWG